MTRLASIAVVLAVACQAPRGEFAAKVVGVSDGDTLTVLTAEKAQVKVRLHGIDCPESKQDFGTRAKQATSDLAFGKDVTIRVRDTDRYGRTVAEVVLPDGRSLNRELVRSGFAWWYEQYARGDRELSSLQSEARAAKRGLWSQPGAVPPWEWRKDGGVAVPSSAAFIGNRNSKVYHTPTCRSIGKMNAGNRVEFASAVEAERAGYRKAGDCR